MPQAGERTAGRDLPVPRLPRLCGLGAGATRARVGGRRVGGGAGQRPTALRLPRRGALEFPTAAVHSPAEYELVFGVFRFLAVRPALKLARASCHAFERSKTMQRIRHAVLGFAVWLGAAPAAAWGADTNAPGMP